MLLTIKYFGMLTEVTNCEEETMDFSGNSIHRLLEELYTRYPNLKEKSFQVAQNKEMVSFEDQLTGNEIVLLPPFAGG